MRACVCVRVCVRACEGPQRKQPNRRDSLEVSAGRRRVEDGELQPLVRPNDEHLKQERNVHHVFDTTLAPTARQPTMPAQVDVSAD